MSEEHIEPIRSEWDERPYVRVGLLTLLVTFGMLMGWAVLAPINSAVVANGRVVVASENKIVQHLDGGLVKTIAVRDGDQVVEGDLLLRLDDEALRIRLEQVQEQLLEARANLERLAAERDDRMQLEFSGDLRDESRSELAEEIIHTQQQLFRSRRSALESELNVLTQRRLQTEKQLEGGDKLLTSLRQRLQLLRDEHKVLQKMARKKLVAQTRVREVEGDRVAIEGEIATQISEMARLRDALAEIAYSATLRDQEYRKEVMRQLRELQSKRIDLLAEQREIEDRLSRVEIRAPVSGKVKGFTVVTLGAVIDAGQSIMEIVPRERAFKIHARISPLDIDAIYPGLDAEVRFPVFDGSQQFPSLFADLQDVSSDVYQDNGSDEVYYKASLVMNDESLGTLESEQLNLVSGMPVDVLIKTGERTLAQYLVKPFSDMFARAFNEG
ncbi:MAG: HlyD family type I secretion periplasmic adaptor subunit [Sedimenticola sp.]